MIGGLGGGGWLAGTAGEGGGCARMVLGVLRWRRCGGVLTGHGWMGGASRVEALRQETRR